jgi:hypothetical protein
LSRGRSAFFDNVAEAAEIRGSSFREQNGILIGGGIPDATPALNASSDAELNLSRSEASFLELHGSYAGIRYALLAFEPLSQEARGPLAPYHQYVVQKFDRTTIASIEDHPRFPPSISEQAYEDRMLPWIAMRR